MSERVECGPCHIVPACDGHFLDPQACACGVGEHFGFDAHAVVGESERSEGVAGEGTETALGVVDLGLEVGSHVGGEGEDLLAEPAVFRHAQAVAFEKTCTIDHIGFFPEDGL